MRAAATALLAAAATATVAHAQGAFDPTVASLSDWFATAFPHLPCFDHSAYDNRGRWAQIKEDRWQLVPEEETDPTFSIYALPARDGSGAGDEVELLSADEALAGFRKTLDAYYKVAARELAVADRWGLDGPAGPILARQLFASPEENNILPYVSKVVVPAGSTVAFFGDIHGSLHSLLRTLDSLRTRGHLNDDLLLSPSFFMVFLGDYVDRGPFGVETLSLVLTLRTRNPGNVFLVRGNHEDAAMNEMGDDGFRGELYRKFKDSGLSQRSGTWDSVDAIYHVYDTLPLALFFGVGPAVPAVVTDPEADPSPSIRFLLCVHGGIELGYDPSPLLRALSSTPHPTSGAHIEFSAIRGLRRDSWYHEAAQASIRGALPRAVRERLADFGAPAAKRLRTQAHWKRAEPALAEAAASWAAEATAAAAEAGVVGGVAVDADGAVPDHAATWPPAPPPQELLAAARAAVYGSKPSRSASGGRAQPYPGKPMDTDPAVGFLWYDFLVHDTKKVAVWNPSRGLAFGRPLTSHWLNATGAVVGVMRAHQHNDHPTTGPMLTEMKKARGVVDNWNGSSLVLTFISGAWIPHLYYPYDSHGLLQVGGVDPGTWVMNACSQAPGWPAPAHDDEGALTPAGLVRIRGVSSAKEPNADAEAPRAVTASTRFVCDTSVAAFSCAPLPWAAGGRQPQP